MRKRTAVLILASLLLLFWAVDAVMARYVRFAEPVLGGDLSALQQKQIDIYVQATQQLLTFCTLLIAGLGLFVDITGRPHRAQLRPGFLVSAFLAAFSIYSGYLSLNRTVWMLSRNFVNLDTPVLYYLRLL